MLLSAECHKQSKLLKVKHIAALGAVQNRKLSVTAAESSLVRHALQFRHTENAQTMEVKRLDTLRSVHKCSVVWRRKTKANWLLIRSQQYTLWSLKEKICITAYEFWKGISKNYSISLDIKRRKYEQWFSDFMKGNSKVTCLWISQANSSARVAACNRSVYSWFPRNIPVFFGKMVSFVQRRFSVLMKLDTVQYTVLLVLLIQKGIYSWQCSIWWEM